MSYQVNDDLHPYRTIVLVEARFGSEWKFGSGVIVGRNDVLTASHVIYNAALGGLADEIIVRPSYDPSDGNRNTSYHADNVRYYTQFDPDGDGLISSGDGRAGSQTGAELDIALLSFDVALGDTYGWMGMTANFTGGYAYVTGHPGVYDRFMTQDYGYVAQDGVDTVLDLRNLEVNSGNSGGPIWIANDSGSYVVGLVSTSASAAAIRGNSQIFDWITENDALLGEVVEPPAATPSPEVAPDYILSVARLYEAAFNRSFDAGGLNYWIDRREGGVALVDMAQAFLDSAEFTTRYGDIDVLNDAGFVTVLYQNVLDRVPDAGGQDYWLRQLDGGLGREETLVHFAESDENVAQSAYLLGLTQVAPGYWDL